MKILLIGGGGREHAMATAFDASGHTVYVVPGSDAIRDLCGPLPTSLDIATVDDQAALGAAAIECGVNLVVVGPEAPLAEGIADRLGAEGLSVFGPSQSAARLESSKSFSKAFMLRHGIPTARSYTCASLEAALCAVDAGFSEWKGVVVKPSGLTAGKGVTVCYDRESAVQCIDALMSKGRYGIAGTEVVIEELLEGEELSVLAFCDGTTMRVMVPSQDHKRLLDGDMGPNTGGMGAYAPAPVADAPLMALIEDEVVQRTLRGMVVDGIDYCGVVYFGLMITATGLRVLEYNCRFGDPEAQVVLPLLENDLAEVMVACTTARLSAIEFSWREGAACCVVMAAQGYPEKPVSGAVIKGVGAAGALDGVTIYHAGTKNEGGCIKVHGGRVLGVTGVAGELPAAVDLAYRGVESIHFHGVQYRRDIAHRGLSARV